MLKHRSAWLLALFVGLAALVALPALAQGGGDVMVVGGDEASLRELLAYLSRETGPQLPQTTVFVGALPPDLPFELPLPEDVRVVGSVRTVREGYPTTVRAILASSLPPEAVIDFYSEALSGEGWTRPTISAPGGGFIQESFSQAMFCQGEGIALSLNANELPDGPTDVRAYIQLARRLPPCSESEMESIMADVFALLPALRAAEVVRVRSGGGGGGGGGGPSGQRTAATEAVLITDIPPADLIELYNAQLIEAGWRHVTTESGNSFAWSGWTFADEDGNPWAGALTLTANPVAEGEYFARLLIEEQGEP